MKGRTGFADQPHWRWTHGHVDDVAAAIALACTHRLAANEIFILGEALTPTIDERLARLPQRRGIASLAGDLDFSQDLHTDTSKIRAVLGFREPIDEQSAMRTLAVASTLRK